MTLEVFTAKLGYRDSNDWLDITRGQLTNETPGGHLGIGLAFAPSLALLRHYLKARTESADNVLPDDVWGRYTQSYLVEMRESYKHKRRCWDELLARDRVVLLCFCKDPEIQCHRHVLARQILPTLGAKFCTEWTKP